MKFNKNCHHRFTVYVLLSIICSVAITDTAASEFRFGFSRRSNLMDHSKQGRFFATTDYADVGDDDGQFLQATRDTKGTFPRDRGPTWLSDGGPTLFGIEFPDVIPPNRCPLIPSLTPPDLFERSFEDGVPRFNQLQIFWDNFVPEPGTWTAAIQTPDGRIVRLEPDNTKRIFPRDRTTVNFDPLPVKKVYIGVRERVDGQPNLVSVRDLRLNVEEVAQQDTLNHFILTQPDLYAVYYSTEVPGQIKSLTAVNMWQLGPVSPLRDITPFLLIDGKVLLPVNKTCPVTIESEVSQAARGGAFDYSFAPTAPQDLSVSYKLEFERENGSTPIVLDVRVVYAREEGREITFHFSAPTLPTDARLGFRMHLPEEVLQSFLETTPAITGNPIMLDTMIGKLTLHLENCTGIKFEKSDGTLAARGWENKLFPFGRIVALADASKMSVALGLPVGEAGKPHPETLNFEWRPSLATDSDPDAEALAPFSLDDLELIEEIDVGNPDDPHVFIDSRNDPVVAAALEKNGPDWRPPGGQNIYGTLPYIENPAAGAVPLVEIAGESCRAIPDKMAAYFRYDLQNRLSARTPYLVVVDHAFDQVRRSAFYSVTFEEKNKKLFWTRGLYGAFEADPDSSGRTFKREYVLCNFTGLSHFSRPGCTDSIVFVNKIKSGPWEKVEGLAIKRIQIYRVKRFPRLPDMTALLPEAGRQRSITLWSEHDRGPNPWYLFAYPKLLGYSSLWTHHDASTRSFGGYPVNLTNVDQWAAPGTLAGNRLLFAAAEKEDLTVNIHFGQLLKIGFEGTDYESFLPRTYMQDGYIPLKPTAEEREHFSKALGNVMPVLSRYRSLRDVCTHTWLAMPFTLRNMRDFSADTGIEFEVSPANSVNVRRLIEGGQEMLDAWRQWAAGQRLAFNEWLLSELRSYRPDIFITLTRFWDHHLIEQCLGYDAVPGVDRAAFARAGIVDYVDYLKLIGIDPAQYIGREGFTLELEAYARLRINKKVPEYFETGWFQELERSFDREGLGLMVHCATMEMRGPLIGYHCPFVVPYMDYRRGLLRSFWYGNPRNITLGSYNEAWGPRLQDLREFAVAFRMLPFGAWQKFEGTIKDTAGQAAVRCYGNRCAMANLGDSETVVTLALPRGRTVLHDLSGGTSESVVLQVAEGSTGPEAQFSMKPWALKTLEIGD